MVACHSVYTSSNCGKVDNEKSWFLESYQKHPGQAATFLAHIKEGVNIAAKDDQALLLFSGDETRKDAGPRSEAQSYWIVAESKEDEELPKLSKSWLISCRRGYATANVTTADVITVKLVELFDSLLHFISAGF